MTINSEQLSLINEKSKADNTAVVCLGMTFENEEARREYFREELRKILPELKQIEGFPIGEDEDVIALSDPPYFTACPNPWINDFIQEWEREKVEKYRQKFSEPYNREPFSADVSEGKNDPIYTSHTYHTKVPYKAIMKYLLHYTNPGDIVLDSYSGTGMTGVAAFSCGNKLDVESLGYTVEKNGDIVLPGGEKSLLGERKAVLNDLSPIASFISRNFNFPRTKSSINNISEKITEVQGKFSWMYKTIAVDDENVKYNLTNKLQQATTFSQIRELINGNEGVFGGINYTVLSDVFECPNCLTKIIYSEVAIDNDKHEVKNKFSCPQCSIDLNKKTLPHYFETIYDKFLDKNIKQAKQIPFKYNYSYQGKRAEKKPDQFDLLLIEKIKEISEYTEFPVNELPQGYNTNQPIQSHGFTNIHHFYTLRNLIVISELWNSLDFENRWILTSFISRNATKMNRFVINKHNPRGRINGPLSSTLYIPSLVVEQSVFLLLEEKIKEVFWNTNGNILQVCTANQLLLGDETVDYIFIDPPFGANIMYSEVNYIWESWLKVRTNNTKEAIQNSYQHKGINEYRSLMLEGMRECYRVLKPGKWITVEFSNTQAAVWNSIQLVIQEAGFVISNVSILDKKHGGIRSMTNTTSVKQDLVISAYKPYNEDIKKMESEKNTIESAVTFVVQHLSKTAKFQGDKNEATLIVERTPRVLFDRMVAYHVQRGMEVPVSSMDFQKLIGERFISRDGMVFLDSEVAEYDKKRILAREFTQQSLFVSDENSAIEWIRQQLMKKPQTRQELHPQFMKEIQHIAKHEQLPELDDLLVQNFLRYEDDMVVPDQIAGYLRRNYREYRGLDNNDDKLREKSKNFWYVPDPNKQADLEKLREKTLLREFEGYVEQLGTHKKKLSHFRTESIRAGFRKAWTEKDYIKIVNVGDRLPETVIQEDDKLLMYYDNAQIRVDMQ